MLNTELVLIVAAALVFDFINGFHDAANAIATTISTRALSPRAAILLAMVLNFAGALVSDKVAKTIGDQLIEFPKQGPVSVVLMMILAALIGAIVWDLATWYGGIPSSSSQALEGGLLGAAVVALGSGSIKWRGGLQLVVIGIILAPAVGLVGGLLVQTGLHWAVHGLSHWACRGQSLVPVWADGPVAGPAPRRSWLRNQVCRATYRQQAGRTFRHLQVFSAAWMAFSHGMNDAQKSMGVMTMALVAAGKLQGFDVPWYVMLLAAIMMGLGTSVGGQRIIKTMGFRMVDLKPIDGFAAETSAAGVIQGFSHFGVPLSTTHVITMAVMGTGAAKRLSAVRWPIMGRIVVAWVLTIPAAAAVAALGFWILHHVF